MNVLALDTASPDPAVSLASSGRVFDERLPEGRPASDELLAAVARCLSSAGASLSDCQRVAVCAGPGSFTGLRVGLATAWGLGRSLGIEVEPASTLEALAETARRPGLARIAAALDAGRGEFVLARFTLAGPRAEPLGPARRVLRETAEAEAEAGDWEIVCIPEDLLGRRGAGPRMLPARALAMAVERDPRPASGLPRGIYSRPSAAEEKLGAS